MYGLSKRQYWLVYGATGSAYCGTGWYLVVLGQKRAVLVDSVICLQKIYGLHGVNHQIIQYSEKEEVITYRQTDKETNKKNFLSKTRPLLWRGSSKYDIEESIGDSLVKAYRQVLVEKPSTLGVQ